MKNPGQISTEINTMVTGTGDRLYSPWQGTMRPVQGLLHGLYVFRVIQDFHQALIGPGELPPGETAYLHRRIDLVEEEVRAVGDLADSRDLTDVGKRFAARLLRRR